MLATTTLSLLFAGLAAASPVALDKRQLLPSSVTPAPAGPAESSMMSSSSMPMPTTTMDPQNDGSDSPDSPDSPDGSGSMNGTSTNTTGTQNYEAYPCPMGYLLTYVNVQQTYDYPLDTLLTYTANWQNATYMGYINGTGGNMVGATRYIGGDAPKAEVLSEYFTNEQNVALQVVMNLTSGPIMPPNGAQLSNYSTTLQVYNNQTASTAGNNATTVKLFCNFCVDNQMLGQAAVRNNFMGALANLATLASGQPLMSMSMGAMPTAMSSAMSMPEAMSSAMSMSSAMPSAMSSVMSMSEAMPSAMSSAMPSAMSSAMSAAMPSASMTTN